MQALRGPNWPKCPLEGLEQRSHNGLVIRAKGLYRSRPKRRELLCVAVKKPVDVQEVLFIESPTKSLAESVVGCIPSLQKDGYSLSQR